MKFTFNRFFSLMLFLVSAYSSIAQWNPNTAVNTLVSDEAGEQSVQKLALCPDGSTYYSWFDSRGGSYAVYLQKLDVNGNPQFAAGGILISGNPQNSSLVDWDMIADNNNNCILTFTDIRSGGQINPFAYMISPAGTQMWGANGIALSDSVNSFQPNPKVVQTSDGNYVFFWRIGSGPQKLAFQKINAAGVKQWGTSPVIWTSGTTENYDWPAIVPSDNGSVIVMFSGYTGSFISPANYRIYSQKVSSAGARVWNATQDTVYSLGRVSGFYTPRLFSDGNSGAVYCWHDDRNAVNLTTGYIQRKNSAGAIQFPVNGTAVSGNTTNNHFAPVAAYMQATGETYVAWQEANSGQTQWGFYAQKINSSGVRQWGDGVAVQSLGTDQVGLYTVMTRDTSAIICFNQSAPSGNNIIRASMLGPSGAYLWPGNIVTASSITSSKIRINSVINLTNGNSILCWQDKRLDGGGIYAQNIKFDGTFGPLTGITTISNNTPGKFELRQNYPNPFNPVTKIRYSITSASIVKLTVYDILGNKVSEVVNASQNAGTYEAGFDASMLASGTYFYRINTEGYGSGNSFTETKKMILIK
ncbi:MAG TPA: T9SS type A sorting domain-containing protein [Ignavibacteria bacterium]|nr:T9SS type A sorting domain-containing protein [Ignavibacteria bacterium]HRF64542.1 T9SS type A sorting domain-containing protein [Ignavibacteria bacterium]HRJ04184.1 T9SS type A sorting domain-containing protein [Ignavibacteria bacterium]HRJ84504.1 T9SS type A sorting domain-containing protein [Ignavibacteria bacterium]